MKANALKDADGNWRDVSKKPATDPTKGSKAGRQAVVLDQGKLVTKRFDAIDPADDQLVPVWRNGEMLVRHDFDAVKERSQT